MSIPHALSARYKNRPGLQPKRSYVSFSDEVTVISHPDDSKLPQVGVMPTSDKRLVVPVAFEKDTSKPAVILSEDSYHLEDFDVRGMRHLRTTWPRLFADPVVILLLLLCGTPICLVIVVAAWALNKPQDLCAKAPLMATFFNGLPSALVSVLPALTICSVLLWFSTRSETTLPAFRPGWTTPRLVLTILLVTMLTLVVMPWTWELKNVTHQALCDGMHGGRGAEHEGGEQEDLSSTSWLGKIE